MTRGLLNQTMQTIAVEYLLRQAPILLMVVDRGGILLRVNEYTANLIGAGPDSKTIERVAKGVTVEDLYELASTADQTRLLNICTGGHAETMVVCAYVVGKDILVLGRPDSAELEKSIRVLSSLNSETSNMARELHKKNTEMEHLNVLKTQFLGMAAHDLRTPLTSIILACDLLCDAPAISQCEQAESIETIRLSAEKMRVLIEDFLESTVIESGNVVLVSELICLREFIESTVCTHRELAAQRGIVLRINVPDECPALCADPGKLEQVLNNYIANAIEYSFDNSSVEIGCSFNESEINVTVRDFGQGISSGEISRLFQPFATAGARKGSGQRNTGLGLFISRRIVEAHGGRTWAESKQGAGQHFLLHPSTVGRI